MRKMKPAPRSIPSTLIIVLLLAACQKGTEPSSPVERTPRDYTWMIDTLAYPGSYQTMMGDIWASSPTDVYVVGHNDRGYGKMFHYDGTFWRAVDQVHPDSQGNASIDLNSVFGFSRTDVWCAGCRMLDNPTPPPSFEHEALIIHYDGSSWIDVHVSGSGELNSLWGSSPTSIWAVGSAGSAFRFDGISWTRISIRDDVSFKKVWGMNESAVLALGYKLDAEPYDSICAYMFRYNGSTWTLEDSLIENTVDQSFGIGGIWATSGIWYSCGYGVFVSNANRWSKVFENGSFISCIWGISSSDLFAGGESLYHYNGIDWYPCPVRLPPFANIYGIWADTKEAFAVANDGLRTFILHGK